MCFDPDVTKLPQGFWGEKKTHLQLQNCYTDIFSWSHHSDLLKSRAKQQHWLLFYGGIKKTEHPLKQS